MAPPAPAIVRSKETMSFSPVPESAGTNLVRLKRQLTEQAIAAATGADWAAAAELNRRILELGPDRPPENRRGQAPRARASARPIGKVERAVAARLLKLVAEGNKYAAGVTSLGDKDVRIIIREVFQDPRNYGKVSFPTAAKVSDLRPYTKGTLVREEMDLEEDLELDEEDEEIEDIERVLPAEVTDEEAFVEEPKALEESRSPAGARGPGPGVPRAATGHPRRASVHESTAVTRLAAEGVLRPPDLRHFDAAVNALAAQPRGGVGLRQALNELFSSRCATGERMAGVG